LQKMSYDVVRDFSPVSMTERIVYVVVVHPSLPVKSIKELITLARARTGELNYGSTGASGSGHLAGELFKSMAGVNILWVPYKSQPQATAAVFSGEVQMTILNGNLVMPYVKAGRLKALAVTSSDRSAFAPELPTVAASGLPGYEAVAISGILAPAKTPAAIVNRLHREIVRFLNLPEVKERFFNTGVEIVASSPEQFAAAVKSEIAKWGKVIKDADIKAD
jgi:tripartite-type tricarboxylate transporter receptor subunit TctC